VFLVFPGLDDLDWVRYALIPKDNDIPVIQSAPSDKCIDQFHWVDILCKRLQKYNWPLPTAQKDGETVHKQLAYPVQFPSNENQSE
jgi:hypothetical protein